MSTQQTTHSRPQAEISTKTAWLLFTVLFLAVQFASLFNPPLMDDVDSAHAQAAQHFAETGDWVTTKINGIRYIEKPPLPYWLSGMFYRIFGENTFATHLPNALAMLGLTWLAWAWARRIWGSRAGLYAGLAVLTSVGPFLFTRFIIPEAQLSFFLVLALYFLLTGLEFNRPARIYGMWALVGLALMTKGLIAPVFFFGAAIPYLLLTGQWRRWRALKPITGFLLFLAVAAPWHIAVGLANPDQGHPIGNHPTFGNVHGFWYFYFINEHLLRFFNERYPHDYNKLPSLAYWLLHFVWLFPWSLFLPAVAALAWKTRHQWLLHVKQDAGQTVDFYLDHASQLGVAGTVQQMKFRVRSIWILCLFSAFTLLFFSISTNQEYYTFPVWPPLFILIAGVMATIEESRGPVNDPMGKSVLSTAWLTWAQGVFAVIGIASAVVLGWGLWVSRALPYVSDIGTVLAHRAVAGYTLSMSHFFDLTGQSFAALRLPAAMAAVTLLIGPLIAWALRLKGKHLAATISMAFTCAVFLIAAHIAFVRFAPMLSSKAFADTIIAKGSPSDTFIIDGEQSDASSVIFYTNDFFKSKPAELVLPRCDSVNGRGTTLLWGSCYPDSPNIFLSPEQLSAVWGKGERKWLFAQDTNREKAEKLLGGRLYPVQSLADKELWTDRPLQ